jgi:hypothetical protein
LLSGLLKKELLELLVSLAADLFDFEVSAVDSKPATSGRIKTSHFLLFKSKEDVLAK